jgi:predicted O-methyltransferase YrrM
MPTYTQDWTTWNYPIWSQYLKNFIGKPIHILEIGSFEGRSTVWFLENILTSEFSSIVCVDPFEQSDEYKKLNVCGNDYEQVFKENIKPHKKKVTIFQGYSQSFPFTAAHFDIIYVDGGHTASNCIFDMVNSWERLNKGGVMIVDDYEWNVHLPATEMPKLAVDSFLAIYLGQYRILHKGYQVLLEKL